MSEIHPDEFGDMTPTLQVHIFHDGQLAARALCESEEEAAALMAAWAEYDGVECEVLDLSAERHDESVFEVEEIDAREAYPPAAEPP